jgi:hypothetical protein
LARVRHARVVALATVRARSVVVATCTAMQKVFRVKIVKISEPIRLKPADAESSAPHKTPTSTPASVHHRHTRTHTHTHGKYTHTLTGRSCSPGELFRASKISRIIKQSQDARVWPEDLFSCAHTHNTHTHTPGRSCLAPELCFRVRACTHTWRHTQTPRTCSVWRTCWRSRSGGDRDADDRTRGRCGRR